MTAKPQLIVKGRKFDQVLEGARIVFMRDGVVVESGPAKDLIDNPQQAATQSFLARFRQETAKLP